MTGHTERHNIEYVLLCTALRSPSTLCCMDAMEFFGEGESGGGGEALTNQNPPVSNF